MYLSTISIEMVDSIMYNILHGEKKEKKNESIKQVYQMEISRCRLSSFDALNITNA